MKNFGSKIKTMGIKSLFKKHKRFFGFLLCFCLFWFGLFISAHIALADGASLYLTPASGSYKVGDNFSINLMLDTAGNNINAAQTTLYFPTNQLQVISISKDNSIFSLWPKEPSFSNASGEISFAGGLPSPGYNGIGKLLTVNFVAKNTGNVNFSFENSELLANDGNGSNVLLFEKNAKYFLYEEDDLPKLFSPTHPNQNQWYSNNSPIFQWSLPADVSGVSFILDKNPSTDPTEVSEGLVDSKKYSNLTDGIWYFHLRTESNNDWGSSSNYKIEIDTTPPKPFQITVNNGGDSTYPSPELSFATKDTMSGIAEYKINIDNTEFFQQMTAQLSTKLLPGIHTIVVNAIDKADNIVRAQTTIDIKPIASPQINDWPSNYNSGQESLYVAGNAVANATITLYLKQNGTIIKKWQAKSDSNGQWSFTTNDLIKPGDYTLSAQATDQNGAQSYESNPVNIKVSFSGISIGGILISFLDILSFLSLVLIFGILGGAYFILRNYQTKEILRKETLEAKESLSKNFSQLDAEMKKKIEMFDLNEGFSEQEKRVYESLHASLKKAKESIEKEIKDIERGLF